MILYFMDNRLTDSEEVANLTCRQRFTSYEDSWYAAGRIESIEEKNSMTPSEFEHATLQLVAYRIIRLRYQVTSSLIHEEKFLGIFKGRRAGTGPLQFWEHSTCQMVEICHTIITIGDVSLTVSSMLNTIGLSTRTPLHGLRVSGTAPSLRITEILIRPAKGL
jgi:hypothetical protein